MARYYWRLVRSLPRLLFEATDRVATVFSVVIFVLGAFGVFFALDRHDQSLAVLIGTVAVLLIAGVGFLRLNHMEVRHLMLWRLDAVSARGWLLFERNAALVRGVDNPQQRVQEFRSEKAEWESSVREAFRDDSSGMDDVLASPRTSGMHEVERPREDLRLQLEALDRLIDRRRSGVKTR